MSSSYLGLTVLVQLHSGGAVKGKITSIDPSTGSLGIARLNGSPVLVTRGEIADLKMLPEEAAPPAAVSSAASKDGGPALGSRRETGEPLGETPRAPAAMLLNRSAEAGTKGKSGKPAKAKSKRGGNTTVGTDTGTSSRTQTEDEIDEGTHSRKRNAAKSKMMQAQTPVSAGDSDLDEDFDFDKALRSFDKRKIWQEIKTSDQTDPMSLLVSHNRINGATDESGRGRFDGRNGQAKLGLHEPVLSPSPTASHASLPPQSQPTADGEQKKNGETGNVNEELQRVRGNALQTDMENSRLKDEVRRLKARAQVLEALSGVELEMQAEEADGHKWKAVIYESLSAHAEARRSSHPAVVQGALTFNLKTYQADASRLRYLGIVAGQSDAAVVQKMPPQYIGEMGLKAESASVFVRRIKDAVQAK